jgi:hypothetical protein
MTRFTENNIEKFIRDNKDKFGVYSPNDSHLDTFLSKLNSRIKNIINIAPYLVRVAIATVLIFTSSILVWNNYIRKDRHQISLGNKISLVIEKIKSH